MTEMTEDNQPNRRWINGKMGLVILFGGILLLAAGLRWIFGDELQDAQLFAAILQGIGGAGTLILAYLYLRQHSALEEQTETQQLQAEIMEGQRDLRRMQLNREVRQQHTGILRHRVEQWLGHTPATTEGIEDLMDQQSSLPVVGRTGVTPARSGMWVMGEEESFRAAPSRLEDDQYFIDLLENHAPDLAELKTKIEELQAEFSENHERFLDGVGEPPLWSTEEYVIESGFNFGEWVFQQIVLMERGFVSYDELFDRAGSVSEAAGMADEDGTVFPGEELYASPIGVYRATAKTGDRTVVNDNREKIENKISGMLRSVLRDIDEIETYDSAKSAAETLDEIGKVVEELRFKLTEYQGLPLYPGECEYLDVELID